MSNYITKPASVLVLALLFSFGLFGQTPIENLQNAVEEYNATKEYINGFDSKSITNENIATVKTRMERGVTKLDKVLADGNAEQVKAARYFRGNFKYQYAFVLGMKGDNRGAYDILREIERDFTSLRESDFPIRYEFFGKNFIIKWENFGPTQAEYYTSIGEVAYNLGFYPDAIKFSKLSLEHSYTSDWLKYIAVNKILDAYNKNNSLITEQDYLDFAMKSAVSYNVLSDENKKIVKENNYPTVLRGSTIYVSKSSNKPEMLKRSAEMATLAARYENTYENALKLFEICYRNNHNDLPEFDEVGFNMASYMKTAGRDIERANYVGNAALDKITSRIGNNCDGMTRLSEGYRNFGNTAKANALDERKRKCMTEREAERLRQEELAKKQAEADRKRQYRYEHPFNMYIGFNLLPLFTSLDKMDFGGHVDLRGRRVAHSFGYAIINKKNDLYSSNEKWDGYRAFYALKVFGKSINDQVGYTGLYFGYSEKEFLAIPNALVNSKTVSGDFYQTTLLPKDKQYDVVWNSGFQALGKVVGMDIWYGIGASYYQISYENLNAENQAIDLDNYSITGADFFEKRNKKDGFSIFMRFGISIGLNVGRKRD